MLKIDLKNRTAVVTGGARGVGAGICAAMASAGARIIVNSLTDSPSAHALVAKLQTGGAQAVHFCADVSSVTEVKAMIRFAFDVFGSLDILVNNAGISTAGSIESLSHDEISRVLDTNVKSMFNCCKEAIPHMREAGFGRIINIASTAMYTGGGGGAHYAASKAAVMGLTRNLAREYGRYGITANALAISLIDTDLFRSRYPDPADRERAVAGVPAGRAGTPEDVGYASAFLASPLAAYINGDIIDIDGGRLYA
ncbi:MAG: glucose 1-dehydrogenase [Clostridiales Family XIII bacterium]|jgi:3-oxoacyl-[acyl-carrier protein] reductase|nr:glucose 1-dehydrogenase [Clostridiales Family XIII bacterium]